MRRPFALSCSLFLVLTAVGSLRAQAPGVQWRHDIEAAKAEAAQTGRLVIVHFWTPSCGPCLRLDSTVFNQPVVGSSIESQFVPVKLNAEEVPAIAQSFNIIQVPTDVVLTPDGQLLAKFVSPTTPTAYVSELMKVANQHRSPPGAAFQQAVAAAPAGTTQVNAAYAGLNIGQPAPTATTAPPAAAQTASASTPPQSPVVGDRYAQVAQHADMNNYASYQPPTAQPTAPPTAGQDQHGAATAPPAVATQQFASHQPPGSPTPSAQMNPYVSPPPQSTPPGSTQPGQSMGVAAAPPAVTAPPNTVTSAQQPSAPATTPNASIGRVATQDQLPAGSPPLAFEGFCPVSMKKHWRWVPGDTRFGAVHLGRTYLFAGQAEQQEFLANPNAYAPALSGVDAVLAVDQRQMVDGRRDFSIEYQGQFYFFSSEDSLQRFQSNPQYYTAGVRQMIAQQQGSLRR